MPTNEDYLDRLWNEVVNIDPKGKWIERGIEACRLLKKGNYAKCADALERLRGLGSAEDLGRVSRESRYTACFELLCSIEDPGLTKRKLPLVTKLLKESLAGKVSPPKSVAEFWRSNMQMMLDPKDDGKWLVERTKPSRCKGPFGDVGPAAERLRKAGATFGDLGCLAAWSRYEASLQSLRLLAESGLLDEESLDGLHEVFLGTEPSGTEAGPKSWPLPKPSSNSASKARAGADPTKPLWKVRSGQAIAISPDSKTVAVAGASGPVRLIDAATGQERLACEGLKAHIYRIAFSPDGKWVAAAQINQWVTICDASTGKLVTKVRVSKDEVSGFVFSSKTGELIRSSWCKEIEVIDPATGKLKEPLRPAANTHMIDCIAFAPDEQKLFACWSAQNSPGKRNCSVWSWPDRAELAKFVIPGNGVSDVAVSSDGRMLAVPFGSYGPKNRKEGVYFIDVTSGDILRTASLNRPWRVAFTPRDKILIAPSGATSADINCSFIDSTTGATVFKLPIPGGVCELSVSGDGNFLAAATAFGGAMVWKFSSILAVAKRNCP